MDKLKKELRLLIGDSIILFQRYEYAFKSVLTLSLIEGAPESIKKKREARKEKISKKSLGQLVRQYIDEIVNSTQSSDSGVSAVQSPHISFRFTSEILGKSIDDIEAEYKAFVDDRNFVVHHLISKLKPDDELSIEAMIKKLTIINEKFEKELKALMQIRQTMVDIYDHILNSDEIKKLLY